MAPPAAAIHFLTPGSPAYAIAKLGAVGGLIALRLAMSRRQNRGETSEPETVPVPQEYRRTPHPVSRKKRQRRRR